MRILKAGVLYFAIVFAMGFVVGGIHVFWMVPGDGVRMLELAEVPVMLAVTVVTAKLIAERMHLPASAAVRAGMGLVGLGLMLAAEWMVVTGIRGLTLAQYADTRDPVAASAYLVLLGAVATAPLMLTLG